MNAKSNSGSKPSSSTAYWLIKSEASCYSIDDLKRDKTVPWSGIRNFQARNFMRDNMQPGDLALFYHSNGSDKAPAGVYGIAKVTSKAYGDDTALDPKDEHFDPKSASDAKAGKAPTWMVVDMTYVEHLKRPIYLDEIKRDPKLEGMIVRERGSRLSIMPVVERHFKHIREVLAER